MDYDQPPFADEEPETDGKVVICLESRGCVLCHV